jgi:hypothetical protein
MISFVLRIGFGIFPEARVPVSHPLREIREFVVWLLDELDHSLGRLYAIE